MSCLSESAALQIISALEPYVSEARQARIREVLRARTRDVTAVLEDVVNDHNGAAVLRTADALGLMEVHLIPGESSFRPSRKVAQGAQKWIDMVRHDSVEACYAGLRRRGFELWVSAVRGDTRPVERIPTDRPVALVFGNEHDGVSPEAMASADGLFHVPMYGFVESLNISVAAALALASVLGARRDEGCLRGLGQADQLRAQARWFIRSVKAAPQLLARAGLTLPSDRLLSDFETEL